MTPLRQARRAMGPHGWSQLQLIGVMRRIAAQYGEQLPGDTSLKTMLSKWENGRRSPDERYGWLLCQALRSTPEALAIPAATPLRPQTHRTTAGLALAGSGDGSIIEVTAIVDGNVVTMPMERRTLLQALLAVGVGGPTGLPAVAERQRVDPAVVQHFARLRAVLVDADNTMGPRHLLATVTQQVTAIDQYRRAAAGRLRTVLLATQSRWAEFAGWIADDVGDRSTGTRWTGLALQMATEADDAAMVGYIHARHAQRALARRDPARILAHADAALHQHHISPLTRAFGLSLRAHAQAITGDLTGCQASLEHAHQLAQSGQDPHDLGGFCVPAYLRMREADCWLDAGQPSRAGQVLQTALDTWPAALTRDRGMALARLATAHLAAAEPEQAAAAALGALEVVTATGSARIHDDVVVLAARLSPWQGRTGVDALLTAVAA
ncbi:hypothetical protein [Krasilnikovia sp. MM14-A1259]|uniref:hypothetical protein n=1 Tax=Krasilnikovia sp. MM14-A1259 TaxID=3373539 RepID=UPI003811CFE4